ncbi:hypothetical protein [Gilliamella apis]|uniref:hypothetical protein n=1 Tax=Gilliamella apis TaxID=1970738 RepID=UPI001C64C054|nr:hypothetical protein [Gilliamella apis]WLS93574.1 hypothetical protein RAM17_10025 [Gilliamella apis]
MSWYKIGTVNVTKNSNVVVGEGTKWTNPFIGICAGQMLILKTQNTIEIHEIASVQSDTELTLATQYSGETKSGLKYEIPTTPKLSIESLALRISEMLNYYQQQMEGWQTVLTGEGEVTLTAPDGRVVTIKSQYSIQKELIQLVEQSKNFASSANKSAATAIDAATTSNANAVTTKTNADNAIQSAKQAVDSAIAAKSSESNASNSAKVAKASEDNAKKWASTIDTSTLVKKSGDTMTGELYINGQPVLTKRAFGLGVSHVLGDESIDETKNQYSGFLFTQQQSKGEKPFNYSHVMRSAVSDSFADIAIDILSRRAKFRGVLTDEKNAAYTGDYSWTEFITTQNISNYIPIGEFRLMPFRANELPFGWYFRNGDNYLLNSPQGQVLNRLSNNYKRDHQITIKTINGQQYINVPSAFAPDGRGFFERAVNGTTRQVGSAEDDAIRNIKGGLPSGNYKALIGHAKIETGDKNGAISILSAGDDYLASSASSTNPRQLRYMFFDFDASRVVPTANENRSLNIGMTPVIYLGV